MADSSPDDAGGLSQRGPAPPSVYRHAEWYRDDVFDHQADPIATTIALRPLFAAVEDRSGLWSSVQDELESRTCRAGKITSPPYELCVPPCAICYDVDHTPSQLTSRLAHAVFWGFVASLQRCKRCAVATSSMSSTYCRCPMRPVVRYQAAMANHARQPQHRCLEAPRDPSSHHSFQVQGRHGRLRRTVRDLLPPLRQLSQCRQCQPHGCRPQRLVAPRPASGTITRQYTFWL